MTGVTARADLLALDADALAALANRGLVKRAAREVENTPPALTLSEDGTVVAGFADGVRTELPVGGLDRGRCTCGAPGICRHVIGLVLAYRQGGPRPGTTAEEPTLVGIGAAETEKPGTSAAESERPGTGATGPGKARGRVLRTRESPGRAPRSWKSQGRAPRSWKSQRRKRPGRLPRR